MLFCDEKCDLTNCNCFNIIQCNLEKIFCPSCKNGFFGVFRYPGRPLAAPPGFPFPAGSRSGAVSGASTEDRPAGRGAGRTDFVPGPCDRQREDVQSGRIAASVAYPTRKIPLKRAVIVARTQRGRPTSRPSTVASLPGAGASRTPVKP